MSCVNRITDRCSDHYLVDDALARGPASSVRMFLACHTGQTVDGWRDAASCPAD